MSTLKLNKAQIGKSVTDANNFTFVSDENAQSLKLNRGTINNEISQVLGLDNSHNLSISGNLTVTGSVNVPTAITGDNDTTVANGAYTKNQLDALMKYYGNIETFASAATNNGDGTKIVFDSSGNAYWAMMNWVSGTQSAVYKLTPTGSISTIASVTAYNADQTDLILDGSGNLYWAVVNYHNGSSHNLTSYVYKITPSGTLTTLASVSTSGALGTSLAFDASGYLYWAVSNTYNGVTHLLTSYVYKINTTTGALSTFASVNTTGGRGTSLIFDSLGNLYWSISSYYNTTLASYSTPSYVYKITSGGVLTTFASASTIGSTGSSLAFDSLGNLYWAITNFYDGAIFNLTSYVYKITPAGALSTFASQATNGGFGTFLLIDSSDNVYWAISNNYNGTTYNLASNVKKITSTGAKTTIGKQNTSGGSGTALAFDTSKNLYWAIGNANNGTTTSLISYLNILYKE